MWNLLATDPAHFLSCQSFRRYSVTHRHNSIVRLLGRLVRMAGGSIYIDHIGWTVSDMMLTLSFLTLASQPMPLLPIQGPLHIVKLVPPFLFTPPSSGKE